MTTEEREQSPLSPSEEDPTPLFWQRNGYLYGRHLEGDSWVCLHRMMYTWRLMLCTPTWVSDFYCYPAEDLALALRAATLWDGRSDPLDGWLRHHGSGRRRPGGDKRLEHT